MDRQIAINLVNNYIKTAHIIPHSYAVEAIMRDLATKLSPGDEDRWGIA